MILNLYFILCLYGSSGSYSLGMQVSYAYANKLRCCFSNSKEMFAHPVSTNFVSVMNSVPDILRQDQSIPLKTFQFGSSLIN